MNLRSPKAHGHVRRAILRENLKENAGPQAHKSYFVWKFTWKVPDQDSAHGILYGNFRKRRTWEMYRKNARPPFRDPQFVWKFTEKKRTWRCQKSHLVWKFTGKMLPALVNTSIEHRVLTVTVRTLQCDHTVWGTKNGEFGGDIAAERCGSCCISASIATQCAQTIEHCFWNWKSRQNSLKTSRTN